MNRACKIVWGCLAVSVLTFAGCDTTQGPGLDALRQYGTLDQPNDEHYAEVAAEMNQNVHLLDQWWSHAAVALRWQENGRSRFEQGEGIFMFADQHNVALTLGKLGDVAIWFGGNQDKVWLINRVSDPPTTWVGPRGASQGLPFAAEPDLIVHLMGMRRVPSQGGTVTPTREGLVVLPPVQPGEPQLEYLLDPQTLLPMRARVLDLDNEPAVTCIMSDASPVRIRNVVPGLYPVVARRYVVTTAQDDGSISITLDEPDPSRVGMDAFNYEVVYRQFGTDHVEWLGPPEDAPQASAR